MTSPQLVMNFMDYNGIFKMNQPKKFNFAKISFKTHDSMKKFINMCIKHYNLKNTTSLPSTTLIR